MYRRIGSLKFGAAEFIYAPTSHGDLDTALNFGKKGTVLQKMDFTKQIMAPTQWDDYISHLNRTNGLPKL